MIRKIQNCYDSHVHFAATGQVSLGLKLHTLKMADDVQSLIVKPEHFRSNWLTGFGWDQNNWSDQTLPTKIILDRHFPDSPVFFSRADGHASWVNSKAAQELSDLGVDLNLEDQSGILCENTHMKALSVLPQFSKSQQKIFFHESQKIFNSGGFTHLRDLSMNLETWEILSEMQAHKNLTVCIDAFVTVDSLTHLDDVLTEITEIKRISCAQLKIHGVKIFADGSLGSKTAYLSKNYQHSSSCGKLRWPLAHIKELITQVWKLGLDVAVHTLGDQAAHEVLLIARQVSADRILGRLHLEHVEVLRPETVQLMKPLHVACYLQPSHWLADKSWLPKTLPPSLHSKIFQWELLRRNKIPFYFGSDSPIEKPFLLNTQKALKLSTLEEVPALDEDWTIHHAHPDPHWTNSWTEFDEEKILQVYFDGEPLL